MPFLFWWLVSQKRALPVAALPVAFYQNNAQLERTACRPQSISRTGQRRAQARLFFFGGSFRRNEPFQLPHYLLPFVKIMRNWSGRLAVRSRSPVRVKGTRRRAFSFLAARFAETSPSGGGGRGRPMVAPKLCTLYFRNHQKGSLVQRELARERLRDCFAETFCFADGRGRFSRPDVKLLFSFRHQIPHPLFL